MDEAELKQAALNHLHAMHFDTNHVESVQVSGQTVTATVTIGHMTTAVEVEWSGLQQWRALSCRVSGGIELSLNGREFFSKAGLEQIVYNMHGIQ